MKEIYVRNAEKEEYEEDTQFIVLLSKKGILSDSHKDEGQNSHYRVETVSGRESHSEANRVLVEGLS